MIKKILSLFAKRRAFRATAISAIAVVLALVLIFMPFGFNVGVNINVGGFLSVDLGIDIGVQEAHASSTEILRPNAAGDYTNIGSQYPNSTYHWDKVDEALADDNSTYVFMTKVSTQFDIYNLPASAIPAGSIINSITVFYRIKSNDNENHWYLMYAYPRLRLGTNETTGTQESANDTWATKSEALARPGGGSWAVSDLANLQVGVGLNIAGTVDDAYTAYCTQVYVEVDYTACSPNISNLPTSWSVNSGSPVSANSNYSTGLDFFTVTNNSGGAVDITISGTDMTGGGYTWDLADNGSPGDMTYALKAGLDGGDYTIVVRETATYNTLVSGLGDGLTQDWGLKLWTPTSYDDGSEKQGTVTLTAVCT